MEGISLEIAERFKVMSPKVEENPHTSSVFVLPSKEPFQERKERRRVTWRGRRERERQRH